VCSSDLWLSACAYGVRGMNLYMVVDRDRWYGAPFDELGRERPHAQDVRSVVRALTRIHFHELHRHADIGIMLPKEYARLTRATHALGAISPSLLAYAGAGAHAACLNSRFGFAQPIQFAWLDFVTQFAQALDHQRLPYVFVDSDAPGAQFESLRVLITPMFEFSDPKRVGRLVTFAEHGGRVLYGPGEPSLDETLNPLSFQVLTDATSALRRCDITDAAAIAAELANEYRTLRAFGELPASVDLTVHEDEHGPRALFLVQTAATDVDVELQLPSPMTLSDAVTGELYHCDDARLALAVPGHSCRMLICERSAVGTSKLRAPSARRSLPPC
jgi:beta-galactosidase